MCPSMWLTAISGDRGQIGQPRVRTLERLACHRDDRAQMLARGQFRHHAAILAVNGHLRCDHGGEDGLAIFDHGGGGFVAGRFDGQNAHYSYLSTVELSALSDQRSAKPAWLRAEGDRWWLREIRDRDSEWEHLAASRDQSPSATCSSGAFTGRTPQRAV